MGTASRLFLRRCAAIVACAVILAFWSGQGRPPLKAQAKPAPPANTTASTIADLAGIWEGGGRAHPGNSQTEPWGTHEKDDEAVIGPKHNFPELNERALAYVKVFDEALSPKYDCLPATPPALEYDPYKTEITQWPDRVLFRYEKDDQLRTVWLDGRQPMVHDWGVQGFSVGQYEGNALIIETTHFPFDITGFDDFNGIPSSQEKKVTERYWRDGELLRGTVTVEDPMFLRKPASYTTRWLPAPKGYKLQPYDCDPETARISVQYIPPKYK